MASLNKKFPRLLPAPIRKGMRVDELIDTAFKAYNGARLAEACRLFTQKMISGEGTVGMSLTGALTPAGPGEGRDRPADEGRICGLDHFDRCESLSRHALRVWAWSCSPARRF
jgi:hypothetical protein